MSILKVDGDALRGFSGNLAQHAAELEARCEAIQRAARQVFGQSWTGAASEELSGVLDRWFADAHGVWEALDSLGRFAGTSADTYEVSDTALAGAARDARNAAGLQPEPTGSTPGRAHGKVVAW